MALFSSKLRNRQPIYLIEFQSWVSHQSLMLWSHLTRSILETPGWISQNGAVLTLYSFKQVSISSCGHLSLQKKLLSDAKDKQWTAATSAST